MLAGNPLTYDGRVLRHAEALAAAGHEVALIGVIGPNDAAAALPALPAVRVYRLDRRRQGVLPRLFWLSSAARRHLAGALVRLLGPATPLGELMVAPAAVELAAAAAWLDAEVYHANDLDTLVPAAWAAGLRRRPYIYDAHELYADENPYLSGDERRARRSVEERLARRARAVLTVNELLADELLARYAIPRPVAVRNVPPLVELPMETAAETDAARPLRLLYHGSWVGLEQPGLDAALQAVAELPGVQLTLRGGMRNPAALRSRLRALGIADRVALLPPLPGAEALVRAAIRESHDIGLSVHLPDCLSRRLATSSKVFEYLMAGLAVVATDQQGNRHILDESCAAFFTPGDAADLLRALRGLAGDRPRLLAARAAARRRAESLFCWEREQRRLLDLYADLQTG
jgi:glycosyltransferase involved in cell wall biosynthesis